MYERHGWVRTPTNLDIPIWRYYKSHRFFDLLESGQLHLTRLDQFTDAFEGVLPPSTVPLAKDGFQHARRNPGDELTDWEMLVRDVNRLNKIGAYANCWYMNERESEGMWSRYGTNGIAIRSTFYDFVKSFRNEPKPVHVGEVVYLDFATEQPPTYGNTLAVAYNKRREFEHERELRAVVISPPADWTSGSPPYAEQRDTHPKGLKVAVDLDALIGRVYLAPGIPASVMEDVRAAMHRQGLGKPVLPSVLDERPTLL
jgi:hypothetical protein